MRAPSDAFGAGIGNAMVYFFSGRRGRSLIMGALVMIVMFGILWRASPETVSRYGNLSNYRFPSWRSADSVLGFLPSRVLTPSEKTLQIENGNLTVPSGLKKGNPSFHLLMHARGDTEDFCKATLSSMILNYPPPTAIGYNMQYDTNTDIEIGKLRETLKFLGDHNAVQDTDIVMIIEGTEVWFQLPSDVMVRQYQGLLREANGRLRDKYGAGADGKQKFVQTVVFGALKVCPQQDAKTIGCKVVPDSPLPAKTYGPWTDGDVTGMLNRAKFLDAASVMGPAKDIRELYWAALNRIDKNAKSEGSAPITAQGVLANLFSEQEISRYQSADSPAWKSWFWRESTNVMKDFNLTDARHEFSIGLDYSATLFQSLDHLSTDPAEYSFAEHADVESQRGIIPPAVQLAEPPYSRPYQQRESATAGDLTPFIQGLELDPDLDELPPPDTALAAVSLFTNPILVSVPAALRLPVNPTAAAGPDVTAREEVYNALWWRPHARALLRRYLRNAPQGVKAAHDAAVGGDLMWDTRGGEGGVWTTRGVYMSFGEEVCVDKEEALFGDDKGRWLHEKDPPPPEEEG